MMGQFITIFRSTLGRIFGMIELYMSWASHRQSQYILGFILFIGIIVFIVVYPIITKPATCFDNKKNGTETGIDCGGSCKLFCSVDVADPQILWSRAFHVSNSTYNLVSFIENTNKSAAIATVSYEFKVYDTNNLLIGRKEGITFIPPNQQFAIFEPRFDSGNSQVRSVLFEFTSPFIWVKKEPTIQKLPIRIDNIIYGADKNSPSLSARINNDSVYDLPAFDVVTIVYDINHNAINASKTHKESLSSNSNSILLFTWPLPFEEDPVTQDILPIINPFSISL